MPPRRDATSSSTPATTGGVVSENPTPQISSLLVLFYHAHVEPGSSPSLSSMATLSLCVTSATALPLGRPRVSLVTSPTSKAPTSFLSFAYVSHTGSWNKHHRASLRCPQLRSELPSLSHLKFDSSTTLSSAILFLLCFDWLCDWGRWNVTVWCYYEFKRKWRMVEKVVDAPRSWK